MDKESMDIPRKKLKFDEDQPKFEGTTEPPFTQKETEESEASTQILTPSSSQGWNRIFL